MQCIKSIVDLGMVCYEGLRLSGKSLEIKCFFKGLDLTFKYKKSVGKTGIDHG